MPKTKIQVTITAHKTFDSNSSGSLISIPAIQDQKPNSNTGKKK